MVRRYFAMKKCSIEHRKIQLRESIYVLSVYSLFVTVPYTSNSRNLPLSSKMFLILVSIESGYLLLLSIRNKPYSLSHQGNHLCSYLRDIAFEDLIARSFKTYSNIPLFGFLVPISTEVKTCKAILQIHFNQIPMNQIRIAGI